MTFNSYRELVCWQLSVQLRGELIEITDRPMVARNFKFCEQVGDSTRSATSNIAEGFIKRLSACLAISSDAFGRPRSAASNPGNPAQPE